MFPGHLREGQWGCILPFRTPTFLNWFVCLCEFSKSSFKVKFLFGVIRGQILKIQNVESFLGCKLCPWIIWIHFSLEFALFVGFNRSKISANYLLRNQRTKLNGFWTLDMALNQTWLSLSVSTVQRLLPFVQPIFVLRLHLFSTTVKLSLVRSDSK